MSPTSAATLCSSSPFHCCTWPPIHRIKVLRKTGIQWHVLFERQRNQEQEHLEATSVKGKSLCIHIKIKTTQTNTGMQACDSYIQVSRIEDSEFDTNLGFHMKFCLKK